MARPVRLDAPGTLHHVMVRGIERSPVFKDDQEWRDFTSRMGMLAQETGTKIVAWALMRNDVHLLLFSGPAGISKFMGRLLTGYALRYNRRHRRNGHLFQNRYKSIVCEEERYLLELVRYIHLNPLRATVVKSVGELDQYPWCGHTILMGRGKNHGNSGTPLSNSIIVEGEKPRYRKKLWDHPLKGTCQEKKLFCKQERAFL